MYLKTTSNVPSISIGTGLINQFNTKKSRRQFDLLILKLIYSQYSIYTNKPKVLTIDVNKIVDFICVDKTSSSEHHAKRKKVIQVLNRMADNKIGNMTKIKNGYNDYSYTIEFSHLIPDLEAGKKVKIYPIYFHNSHENTSKIADYVYLNCRHKETNHGYEYTYRRINISEICKYLEIENNKASHKMILRSLNTISNTMMELNSPFPIYAKKEDYFVIKDFRYDEVKANKIEQLKGILNE